MSHWLPPALNRSSKGERSRVHPYQVDFLQRTYHSVHDPVKRLSLIMKEHLLPIGSQNVAAIPPLDTAVPLNSRYFSNTHL